MKIILKDDVNGLGEMGDVVVAKGGFARNYLIPRHIAIPATHGNMSQIASLKKRKEIKRMKEKEIAQELSGKIQEFSCSIAVKVGENGKLFGSVTSIQIAEKLNEAGFEIDKKKIVMDEPIKKLGVYAVPVKLHQDVSAAIKVWVVDENEGKSPGDAPADDAKAETTGEPQEVRDDAKTETAPPPQEVRDDAKAEPASPHREVRDDAKTETIQPPQAEINLNEEENVQEKNDK